jgi:hypothetical protein
MQETCINMHWFNPLHSFFMLQQDSMNGDNCIDLQLHPYWYDDLYSPVVMKLVL